MACHNVVRTSTDFLYSLKDHAFPSNVPNLLLADTQFKQLQSLLLKSVIPASEAKARALATASKAAGAKSKAKDR